MAEPDAADLLERASDFLIDWSAPDLAGNLSVQLARYSLARLHLLEALHDCPPSARCIVGPDSSPSRNPARLAAGYSTGGEYWWSLDHPIMPLDHYPNCCGIALARVDLTQPATHYYQRLHDLARTPPTIDGTQVIVDVNRKNHFLGTYRASDEQTYAVIHCSAPEHRADSPTGLGLNHHDSPALAARSTTSDTALGPVTHLAEPADQSRYLETGRIASEFARRKRLRILQLVFGDAEVLADRQHQGNASANHFVLGSQLADTDGAGLYAYLLGADRSLQIAHANTEAPILTDEAALALVPHGCGYTYNTEYDRGSVDYVDGRLRFTLTHRRHGEAVTGSLDHLPITDRRPNTTALSSDVQHCELVANYRL